MAIFKYSAGDSSLLCRSKEPNHPKMMCNNTNKASLKKRITGNLSVQLYKK